MQNDSLELLFLSLVSWALIPKYENSITFWDYDGSTVSSWVLVWLSQSKVNFFPWIALNLICNWSKATGEPELTFPLSSTYWPQENTQKEAENNREPTARPLTTATQYLAPSKDFETPHF